MNVIRIFCRDNEAVKQVLHAKIEAIVDIVRGHICEQTYHRPPVIVRFLSDEELAISQGMLDITIIVREGSSRERSPRYGHYTRTICDEVANLLPAGSMVSLAVWRPDSSMDPPASTHPLF